MERQFKESACTLVATIPAGRVMTYGQIAALCGSPQAARVVGQIAHFGRPDVPWHRVVNAQGGLAAGFEPGGRNGQAQLLAAEQVAVTNNKVDLQRYLWWPSS